MELRLTSAIRFVASVTAHDGNGDLLEGAREGRATLRESTPTSDSGAVTVGRVGAGGRKGSVAESLAVLSDVLGQLPDGNVVLQGGGAVVGVDDDLGDTSSDTAGTTVLRNNMLANF